MKRVSTVNSYLPNKGWFTVIAVTTTVILISVAVSVWYITSKRGNSFNIINIAYILSYFVLVNVYVRIPAV